jgi:hypothetical protein
MAVPPLSIDKPEVSNANFKRFWKKVPPPITEFSANFSVVSVCHNSEVLSDFRDFLHKILSQLKLLGFQQLLYDLIIEY